MATEKYLNVCNYAGRVLRFNDPLIHRFGVAEYQVLYQGK
jgi:hypothetical protein